MIDTVALLLADRSPALRYRALVEVDGAPEDDPEVVALRAELPAASELDLARRGVGDGGRDLSFTLCRLAYVGLRRGHPDVDAIAERLFSMQRRDGSWPVSAVGAPPATGQARKKKGGPAVPPEEGYEWRPLQSALPLRGLAAVGYATDPRAERAYEWLLDHRFDDGSWPYGKKAGHAPGAVVGYRRLPRSEGCRATTTGALACLAHHPERRTSEEAQAAADILLRRETREESTLGYEVARLVGLEQPRGFATFYARFDLAFLLDLASRVGVARGDARIDDLIDHLESLRGEHGLWPHPTHPHLSRWLPLDVLASLGGIDTGTWIGGDEHIPVRAYPRRRRRY